MKKPLAALLTAVFACGNIPAVYPAAYASSEKPAEFTQEQIDASEVKPELYLTIDGQKYGKVFKPGDLAGKTVTCSLNVSGAEGEYVSTQLHILYDKRLTVKENDNGKPCTPGEAISDLYEAVNADVPSSVSHDGIYERSLLISTYGIGNDGKDGVMWSFDVEFPAEITEGDFFPLDIRYSTYPEVNIDDFFAAVDYDKERSLLMQAYTFSRGIFNGETRSFEPSSADVSLCQALSGIPADCDGYIAVEGTLPVTTTSTTATTTTTTTTTTVMPGERVAEKTGKAGPYVNYTYYNDGTLILSGKGKTYDCHTMNELSEKTPHFKELDINKIIVEEGITTIGNDLFMECSASSVELPDTLTEIGMYGLCSMKNLETLVIPDSVTKIGGGAFSYDTKLSSIKLPENLIEFGGKNEGGGLFQNCTSLTSIDIPDTVTEFHGMTFLGCTNLEEINIPDSVTVMNGIEEFGATKWIENKLAENNYVIVNGILLAVNGLSGDITIPDTVKTIGNNVFYNEEDITSVTIPDSVTSIEDGAFSNAKGLKSITIPDSVTSIGASAFDSCESLESVVLPSSVTEIGAGTFQNCTNLRSVTIPDSVTSIGQDAFADCENLAKVNIPDSVTSISKYSFENTKWFEGLKAKSSPLVIADGILFDGFDCEGDVVIPDTVRCIADDAFSDAQTITSVIIPDPVVRIGKNAFGRMSGLKSISIPDSVEIIEECAFSGCYDLETVKLPSSLSKIEDRVFERCNKLNSITIPDTVTSIGFCAFYGCESLEEVTIPDSVTSIGSSAFADCGLNEINLPDSVTEIGQGAFSCKGLESFGLPAGIKDISNIFTYSPLKKYVIPDTVEIVGEYAFAYSQNLEEVTVPAFVTTIGENAFYGCKSLSTITILNADCDICDEATTISYGLKTYEDATGYHNDGFYFGGTIRGYEGSTAQAFAEKYGCNFEAISEDVTTTTTTSTTTTTTSTTTSTTSTTKSNTTTKKPTTTSTTSTTTTTATSTTNNGTTTIIVTEDSLTFNVYPDHAEVSTCDDEATGKIIIPTEINGVPVTAIGLRAFAECAKIEAVEIPDTITTIGYLAFYGCNGLTSVTIPDSVTEIEQTFDQCPNLETVILPDSITLIGVRTFTGCTALKNITIPASVTKIDSYAFSSSGLKSITIPDTVTELGRNVFERCKELEEITIPASISDISWFNFINCPKLKYLTVLNPDCLLYSTTGEMQLYCLDDVFTGTIRSYENSKAQAYAEEYGYKFEAIDEAPKNKHGDINGDGKINPVDASLILVKFAELSAPDAETPSEALIKEFDINGDGRITAVDASLILAYCANLAGDETLTLEAFLADKVK